MAPELMPLSDEANQDNVLTQQSDIYAFAMLAFQVQFLQTRDHQLIDLGRYLQEKRRIKMKARFAKQAKSKFGVK